MNLTLIKRINHGKMKIYLNYVGMKETRKQGDFRLELLLEFGSGFLVLVWDSNHLNSDGSLFVNSTVYSTVSTGGEFVTDEELR